MVNPFLDRAERKRTQPKSFWRSKKQEKDLSKRLGARQISGSGSGRKKGDLFISGIVRIEAKTTLRGSFSITKEMIDKITHAGLASDELPVIVVEFINEQGKPTHEVALVSVTGLQGLLHAAKGAAKAS